MLPNGSARRCLLIWIRYQLQFTHVEKFREWRRLVGNATLRLLIDRAGRFVAVDLIRQSGDEQLDSDALQAAHSASGFVRRPGILGSSPIQTSVVVKYQLGL